MTESIEAQHTLVSLQINADSMDEGRFDVLFTGLDAAGDPLTGSVLMLTQHMMQFRDKLTEVAGTLTPGPVGWYGQETRVGFDLTQGESAGVELVFTVANATGAEGYQPPFLRAPVTSAALTRLAQGMDQILQRETRVVNWVPAE